MKKCGSVQQYSPNTEYTKSMLTRTMRPLFVETITSVEQKKRSFSSKCTILNISKYFLNIHKKIPKILLSIPKRRGRWISDRLYRKQKYCQSSRFPLNLWHDIIRNLERIMTVDQIDVFFVLLLWPNNPMGQIMNFQHPDVENMIKY